MAFDLAEMFVTIGMDDSPFQNALGRVKKSIQRMTPHFEAISSFARKAFLGLVGLGTGAVAAFADAEKQEAALRAALQATGQEVDKNMEKLSAFATNLSRVTTLDDDAAKGLMAYATNLGITADKLETVTELGVGLGESLFGGDSKAGIEAVAKAYNGNFRALQQLIPGLKDAKTNAEKWAIVQKAGAAGFVQAQAQAKTFTGQLKQLWNETGNVAESFGEVLAPALGKAVGFLKAITLRLQSLTPEQQKQIVKWGLYAAGVAAVIGFGPKILSFGASVVSAFVAISQAALSLGIAIVTGIFSPFGLIVAGAAAAVGAFAYFAGGGGTAVGRIIDAFKRMFDFVKFVFNNSSSLGEAWSVLIGGFGYFISDAWTNAKALMMNVWTTIKTAFRAFWEDLQHVVTGAVVAMTEFFVNAWDKAMNAHRAVVKATGDAMTDTWIAAREAMGTITKEQADEERKYIADARNKENQADAQADAERAAAKKKFFEDMRKLEDEQHAANMGGIGLDEEAEKAKTEAERKARIAENAKQFQAFKDQQADSFKRSGKESLSQQIEDLYAKAKDGLGVDDLMKLVDKLKSEADALKNQAAEEAGKLAGGGKDKAGKDKKGAKGTSNTQDIESAFKADLARSIAAASGLPTGKKKAEELQQENNELQKVAVDEAKKQTKTLVQILKARGGVGLGTA